MAYKWGLLTTYDTWDDPPSTQLDPWDDCIFTYMAGWIFTVNVDKYTVRPMDPRATKHVIIY